MSDTYEYAGFHFTIVRDAHGKAIDMRPVAGQHPASRKEKHRRNALQMYLDDKGEFEKVRATVAAVAKLPPADLGPDACDPAVLSALRVPPGAVDTTVTHWRPRAAPTAVHSPASAPPSDAPALTPCPSCDGPLTVGAKACPTCGAATCP